MWRFADAANQYGKLIDLPWPGDHELFQRRLRWNIAKAHELAGDLPAALHTLEALHERFPDEKGVFREMARMEAREKHYEAACELLFEEYEQNPSDQDWLTELALVRRGEDWGQLLDQVHERIDPTDRRVMETTLATYWPTFNRLSESGRREWLAGTWLLNGGGRIEGTAQAGAAGLVSVVEHELKTRIFGPYREDFRRREQRCDLPEDRAHLSALKRFLTSLRWPGLGTLFQLLQESTQDDHLRDLANWIRRFNPQLLQDVLTLDTRKITRLGDDRRHRIWRSISLAEAQEGADECRKVLDALLPSG